MISYLVLHSILKSQGVRALLEPGRVPALELLLAPEHLPGRNPQGQLVGLSIRLAAAIIVGLCALLLYFG